MKPVEKPWNHYFDEAFRHFDRGLKAAENGFKNAPAEPAPTPEGQLIEGNGRKRFIYAWRFLKFAVQMLFHGRVRIRLK